MSRGLEVSLLALMLLATALSGCISSDDDSTNGDGDEEPVDEEFLGLDYIECMIHDCLLYTSPSPRDKRQSRMPSSA